MITVNETLFSKLVSGGEPCLITIDGEYGGYVKADSACQHGDGRLTVDLMTVDAPTPVVEVNVKEEVEHIDTGFEGLVYTTDFINKGSLGCYTVIEINNLSQDQITFFSENVPMCIEDKNNLTKDLLNYQQGACMNLDPTTGEWFCYTKDEDDTVVYFNDIFV